MLTRCIIAMLGALLAATPALAQSNIDTDLKYSWCETSGWMNWRDAGAGADGVVVHANHLSGYIWSESAGWINVGPGGGPYANTSGATFGVNIETGGWLAGRAWNETTGWIEFGTEPMLGAQGARYDAGAGRFRGYAWGENMGWVNLDDDTRYVATTGGCPADFDGNGVVAVPDIFAFLSAWFAGHPSADFDGNALIQVPDIFAFLSAWFAGC